jgi:hypothetical protein
MIHRFSVGRLMCAVISDGQPEPPFEPRLDSFFTPEGGVPAAELSRELAGDPSQRTTLTCGYNCLVAQTPDGLAVIDTGLGARFGGYGPWIEPLVGKLGGRLAAALRPGIPHSCWSRQGSGCYAWATRSTTRCSCATRIWHAVGQRPRGGSQQPAPVVVLGSR